MGKNGKRPRIRIGDATGSWKCVLDDDTLTLRDIRLIHRAIDVAVRVARRDRKLRSRQKSLDERVAREAALQKEAEDASREAEEAAIKEIEETEISKLQKAADDAAKAEAEKETK